MEGMIDIAERVFGLSARMGVPTEIGGLVDVVNSPMYATSVGLVLYGYKSHKEGKYHQLEGRNLFYKIFTRMKGWMEEFF